MHRTILAFAFLLASIGPAHAQLQIPRLNSIFPCGGRQGMTVDCVVAGGELTDATGLYFSHPGITGQPAGANKFKIVIAKDVPVGPYDVRVVTPLGLSNFRAFVVGDVPETLEKEPNNEPAQAQRVALPTVINGKMDGGTDLDHYVFAAKKGQRIVVNCWAWRLDSQLDGTLQLTDPKGKQVAYSGDYYGRDPFIDFTAQEDGDYTVKIWDFVYSGGSDYFYRLHISRWRISTQSCLRRSNPARRTASRSMAEICPEANRLPAWKSTADRWNRWPRSSKSPPTPPRR